MKNTLYEKILGSLAMVAIGDALGMPCHDMTIDEIKQRFGGTVTTFHPPFKDTRVHPNLKAGNITDDTLLTLALADAYIEGSGRITPSSVCDHSLKRFQKAKDAGCEKMFGPSTRKALEAVVMGLDPIEACLGEKHPTACTSNGAAMKIAPAGLVHPGDLDAAIEDAVTASLPSHGTQAAIASACAVAAGISRAMTDDADVFSVVQAALYGARKGQAIGMEKARTVPVPSVEKRIELAVSLALNARDPEEAGRNIADLIGTGLAAYESIPAAVGLFVAGAGDPEHCVVLGANAGYDTDTIAAMAGAMAGALKGFDKVPKKLYDQVVRANTLTLEETAQKLEKIAQNNLGD